MKYILAIVLILIVATVIFIIRPQPGYQAGISAPAPAENPVEGIPVVDQTQLLEDRRRAAMEAEFELLARARRDLEQKLNKLKVVLWDLKLPRSESDVITGTMQKSYAKLKNPGMLGAYSSLEEISAELARVNYLYTQLQEIEDKYRSKETQQ